MVKVQKIDHIGDKNFISDIMTRDIVTSIINSYMPENEFIFKIICKEWMEHTKERNTSISACTSSVERLHELFHTGMDHDIGFGMIMTYASKNGDLEIIKCVHDEFTRSYPGEHFPWTDDQSSPVIFSNVASIDGKIETMEFLREHGCPYGDAMFFSVVNKCSQNVRWFFENTNEHVPLEDAARHGTLEITQILHDDGDGFEICGGEAEAFIEAGNVKGVKWLIDMELDTEWVDIENLMYISLTGKVPNLDMADMLFENGCVTDLEDYFERAIRDWDMGLFEWLMNKCTRIPKDSCGDISELVCDHPERREFLIGRGFKLGTFKIVGNAHYFTKWVCG